MSLLKERTITLLKETGIPLDRIARDTGLTIGWLKWLKKPASARRDPGVDKVEALYNYLSRKQLKL